MSMNTRCLVVIFLSLGVLLIGGVKFKYIKYCGPKDKTFKYNVILWPVLIPGEQVNFTVTFTPCVDVLYATLRYDCTSKGGEIFVRGTADACELLPRICSLPAGETVTRTFRVKRLRTIPPGFKGITFIGRFELYNQDQLMWFCLEAEAIF